MKKLSLCLSVSLAAAILAGCATGGGYGPNYYTVQRGDTLSKIAATYNLNYQALARQNNLQYPYIIRPGQTLYVGGGGATYSTSTVGQGLPARTTINNVTTSSVQPISEPSQISEQTLDLSQYGAAAPKKTKVMQDDDNTTPAASPVDGLKVSTDITEVSGGITWSWPVNGTITEAFGEGANLLARGVQIKVPSNSDVYAAASGDVIFSGMGAQNYGKMIIIKHGNNFLTAYTNLSKILITQGQKVKLGQAIAVSGNIDHQSLLHFEVRKFGSPVNPLIYLPAPSDLKPSGSVKAISKPKIDSAN